MQSQTLKKTLPVFESLKNSLYLKTASYELDLSSDLKNDMFLYLDIFKKVGESTRFRVRVRKRMVERLPRGVREHRALLIDYAVVHEDMESFEACSEEEALRHAVQCIAEHGKPDIELAYSM